MQHQQHQFHHHLQQNPHMHMQPTTHQMPLQSGHRMEQSVSMQHDQAYGMHSSGMHVSPQNMHGSQHPMSGLQNLQTITSTVHMQQPQQNNYEIVAVPVGTIPPQGAILASTQTITATTPDQFMPMSENYHPNLCVPSCGGKFRIINPKTGEEVGADKRYRIMNPKTGREVRGCDEAADAADHESCLHFESRYYENSEAVGGDAYDAPAASWDWPLSRREIQDRLERLP
jgi:hypothetical protein